ncbi:MAG: phosphoribosyl-ATP diphosphatase [Candidatus Nitrotoga sp.]
MADDILQRLTKTIAARKNQITGNSAGNVANNSYVAKLFSKGEDAILKKIGEEATEVLLAAKSGDAQHLVYETADLWFHCMVLLAQHNRSAQDVLQELARREGVSGLNEKANREVAGLGEK